MKHDFIDKYSHLSSPVHSLDPRGKIVAVLAGIIIIVTEPVTGVVTPFLLYFVVVMAVTLFSRLPLAYLAGRILVVSPFILMAALFYPLSVFMADDDRAFSIHDSAVMEGVIIFFKAFLAVMMLIVMTSSEKFQRLLLGLRRLKFPRIITTISALLYRYVFVLADETLKTSRARESRTPGRLRVSRIKTYGNQVAVIFLRSWDRSQVIYKSMLSRGFMGEFPDMQELRGGIRDVVIVIVFITLLLAIRLWL